jgi:SAM-dependent methyltransferase
VTPEIARAARGLGIRLIAVDRCLDMIHGVWPDGEVGEGIVLCGDWRAIPLADGSVAGVIGDGCFTLLDYPQGYRKVFQEVHRVLSPEGRFVMRYFCRPDRAEPLDLIEEDLWARRIGNVHVLKWRLAMALHGTIDEGISVQRIWRTFQDMVPDRGELQRRMGWTPKEIDTLDVYRGSPAVYTFPTLEEVREVSGALFHETSILRSDYELGSRCPTVCYSPRRQCSPTAL